MRCLSLSLAIYEMRQKNRPPKSSFKLWYDSYVLWIYIKLPAVLSPCRLLVVQQRLQPLDREDENGQEMQLSPMTLTQHWWYEPLNKRKDLFLVPVFPENSFWEEIRNFEKFWNSKHYIRDNLKMNHLIVTLH